MILVDVSSVLHRMIYGSTKDTSKIRTENNKYITEDFILLTLHYIMEELINVQLKYREYGEMVLCFDDYKKEYWRKDVYSGYKFSRKDSRDTSLVNYQEVFSYTNELFEQLKKNTPWKCVFVNRAEADDVILVLAAEFNHQKTLILSPDKDFIQSQKYPNIFQYSPLTKKWIVPENKHDNMMHWVNEHIMLGDTSDGVPKVTDHTEFSNSFKEYLNTHSGPINEHLEKHNLKGIDVTQVHNFYKLSNEMQKMLIDGYSVLTFNRKGQETGFDIFDNQSFGASNIEKIHNGVYKLKIITEKLREELKNLKLLNKENPSADLKQKIKEVSDSIKNLKVDDLSPQERLDEFLDSHPLYRENYNRNYILVMEEGIPEYVRKNILMEYSVAETRYDEEAFMKYLDSVRLNGVKTMLPKVFKSTEVLDITNCGW